MKKSTDPLFRFTEKTNPIGWFIREYYLDAKGVRVVDRDADTKAIIRNNVVSWLQITNEKVERWPQ